MKTKFLNRYANKKDPCHLQTLLGQVLLNCGDHLHTTGTAMVPILILEEPSNRYSKCLFQGHGLLKYTVFCYSGSYGTRQG